MYYQLKGILFFAGIVVACWAGAKALRRTDFANWVVPTFWAAVISLGVSLLM